MFTDIYTLLYFQIYYCVRLNRNVLVPCESSTNMLRDFYIYSLDNSKHIRCSCTFKSSTSSCMIVQLIIFTATCTWMYLCCHSFALCTVMYCFHTNLYHDAFSTELQWGWIGAATHIGNLCTLENSFVCTMYLTARPYQFKLFVLNAERLFKDNTSFFMRSWI